MKPFVFLFLFLILVIVFVFLKVGNKDFLKVGSQEPFILHHVRPLIRHARQTQEDWMSRYGLRHAIIKAFRF